MLRRICREHQYNIGQLQVMPDRVHFYISVPPRIAPAEVVKHLKGVSARKILVQGHLWASTYYVATVGKADDEAVTKYVEGQRRR